MTDVPFFTLDMKIERLLHVEDRKELAKLLHEWGLSARLAEEMWLIALDADKNIRAVTLVGKGGFHDVHVSVPFILTSCLVSGSDRFVLAHNHPSTDVSPSTEDLNITKSITKAAKVCDMWFEDHFILGPGGIWASMATRGEMG